MPHFSRDFYEQNSRAALLRNLCLDAVMDSEVVLASGGEDAEAFGRLLDLNHRLGELGVQPGMHRLDPNDPQIEEKREQIATHPTLTAEWIAGQVREVFIESSLFQNSGGPAAIAEHDMLQGEGEDTVIIDSSAIGPRTRNLVANIASIWTVRRFLDVEAGPSDLDRLV